MRLEIYHDNYTKTEMKRIYKDGYEYILDGNTPREIFESDNNEEINEKWCEIEEHYEQLGYTNENGLIYKLNNELYDVVTIWCTEE